ncbi:hypothetical protein MBLNU457_4508t1 [Dothideomycetes sp. NU457]
MLRSITTAYFFLAAVCATRPHNATVKLVHQYQPITWVENLAIRPNGFVLPIFQLNTSSSLTQIDPRTGESCEIYDFSAAGNTLSSITAVQPDVFAVVVTTCSLSPVFCTLNSGSIWRVDLRSKTRVTGRALVTEVAKIPEVEWPNGMATFNDHTILLADSTLGGVWSIDIWTGQTNLLITDLSMNGTSTTSPIGINGVRYAHGELYFTNEATNTLNRVSVDPVTGHKTGDTEVIASGFNAPDDFELDLANGFAYVAGGRTDALLKVDLNTGSIEPIAAFPGPTSARFGGKGTLYVSTNGDLLQGNTTMGGAIYEVDLR